jgi:hypothetical protein
MTVRYFILYTSPFASRHIMSVTGHRAESSLKTHSGQTELTINRQMLETISEPNVGDYIQNATCTSRNLCARDGKLNALQMLT